MSPLQGLDETTLVLFAAILFFAGLVHGTLGLGFPLTATPVLALFTDMRSAIVITLFPTVAVNVLSIVSGGNWRSNVRAHWPLAAYAGMGSIVFKHQGIVDKYLGDGFLAVFGAPVSSTSDADNAVGAALDMQASLSALNAGLQKTF